MMKPSVPAELLRVLGLSDEQVRLLEERPAPPDPAGHGLSFGGALPAVEADPSFSTFRLQGLELGAWDRDPAVIALARAVGSGSGARAVQALAGDVRTLDDELVLLDARRAPSAVRLELDGRALVLRNDAGSLGVYELIERDGLGPERDARRDARDGLGAERDDWREPPPPPSVDRVIGGRATDGWLLDDARALERSPRWLDRAAAVGLLGRLWAPIDAEDRRAFVAGRLELPVDRLSVWLDGWTDADRGAFVRLVLRAVDDVRRRFDDALSRHDPPELLRALRARDDLESVAWLAERAGERNAERAGEKAAEHERLRVELSSLDHAVTLRRTELLAAGDLVADDPRLTALRWIAPEAWWAR